ncbi:MAG TPA: M56 family metallopeptidase [Rhizomicrobium sp.]|jgi:beta-lactamase regulating signal transducer with metallopeptidase domain|nr:M56 family metallopeptidase [Rhizomicrobium sp.]
MSDLSMLRAVLFAAELFAGSSLIVVLARLLATRRSASARHMAWSAAFGALLLLPLPMAALPGAFEIALPAPPQAPVAQVVAVSDIVADAAPVPQPAPGFVLDAATIAYGALGLWLAGVIVIAARGVASFGALWFLRRTSAAHPFEAAELDGLPPARPYELRIAKGRHGPITWGVLRPVILLPRASLFWPSERLEAVLRHELAHVRRHDSLTQTMSLAACALYWPNPLVWLARAAQRREAEMAADDAVLADGMMPSDYAGALLEVAAEVGKNRLPAAMALFMAAPPALSERVQAILSPSQMRKGVTAMDILKTAAIALLTTGALVAARPSLAQDAPPAPVAAETPDTAPAPPVPPVPPVPDVAPIPNVAPAPAAAPRMVVMHDRSYRIVRKTHDSHGNHVSVITVDDPKMVEAEMARVRPEIERAMAQVKTNEVVIRRIKLEQPRIDAEVQRAMAQARAALAQVDDAKVRAKIDEALARAQKRLDAEQARLAHEQADIDKGVKVGDGDVVIENDDDMDNDTDTDKDDPK